MRYGFIGCGNMGGAVARAVCRGAGAEKVLLANRTPAKAEALAAELGCSAGDNLRVASDCHFIFLGVKPQVMPGMLADIAPVLAERKDSFVLVTMATFASALLLPGVSNIFLPAIAALISGSVYMLLAAKLQKFGGITIMGLVMGLFFFVSGHFVLSFAANILFGVLADWVASLGKYHDCKLLFVSYILFSYGLTGPILPLWFMKDAYVAALQARGKDAAYIDALFAPIN